MNELDAAPARSSAGLRTFEDARHRDAVVDPVATFLYVGEFAREHQLYSVIHAIELTRIRRMKARLVLAGCGPQEQDLRYFAKTLKLERDVLFEGPVFAHEKRALFDAADALICPGAVDHVPYVVRDAVESGLRVIALRDSAIGKALKEGSQAIFLRAAWPHLICEAMVLVARSRRLRVTALPAR